MPRGPELSPSSSFSSPSSSSPPCRKRKRRHNVGRAYNAPGSTCDSPGARMPALVCAAAVYSHSSCRPRQKGVRRRLPGRIYWRRGSLIRFNGSESSAAGTLMIDRECASHPIPLETPEVGVLGLCRESLLSLEFAGCCLLSLSRESRVNTCTPFPRSGELSSAR